MSSSLKDQLLSAGLLTKEQARSGSRKKRPKKAKGRKRELDPETRERQALVAAHEQRRKDESRELNRQREQARKAQEQADRIRQILGTRALPKHGVNDETTRFHFQLEQRIHGLHVSAPPARHCRVPCRHTPLSAARMATRLVLAPTRVKTPALTRVSKPQRSSTGTHWSPQRLRSSH